MSRSLVLAALLPLATPLALRAEERTQVPTVLAHYGRLLAADDRPVNASVQMTFELHTTDNPVLHQPKWSDTKQVVVTDGLYGTLLGDVRTEGKPLDQSLLAEPELYVSVTINGSEMLPRLRIPSVPYALRTLRSAETEKVLAGGVDTNALKDGAVTLAKLQLTGGKMVGLDADTLDGLDASAFAPAAIETKIDAIAGSVGSGLFEKLAATQALIGTPANGGSLAGGLQQANDSLATLATSVGGVKTDVAAVKTDTTTLKNDTTTLKTDVGTVKTDTGTLKSDHTAMKTDLGTLKTDVGSLKTDVGSLKTDSGTLKGDTAALKTQVGTMASGRSLAATLSAMQRYSVDCNPATDSFLRDAYPGLTDAQVTDACFRDGRWHKWGTAYDIVMGLKSFPSGFEVGISSYGGTISAARVNSWNVGWRFCWGPVSVGDGDVVSGSNLVVQCMAPIVDRAATPNRTFTVTHAVVDSATAYSIKRTYTGLGNIASESTTPCTVTGAGANTSCGNSESYATHWGIWLRQ